MVSMDIHDHLTKETKVDLRWEEDKVTRLNRRKQTVGAGWVERLGLLVLIEGL